MAKSNMLYLEVKLKTNSSISNEEVMVALSSMNLEKSLVKLPCKLKDFHHDHIEDIRLDADYIDSDNLVNLSNVKTRIYKLHNEGGTMDCLDGSDDVHCFVQYSLPNREFDGLWENLFFDSHIKYDLLNYVTKCLLLHKHDVDPNVVGLNRMVLFHGPPGTGKTSICKALAHKSAIRLANTFSQFELIEINSHSLFSKWFSESGKLVQRMFDQIYETLDNKDVFLFVLIDEVESLTRARESSANEPSDGLRVVNALLTQIDKLRSYGNVLLLATSNLKDSMDPAFVDRVDMCHYLGLPPVRVSYEILRNCVGELVAKGVLAHDEPGSELLAYDAVAADDDDDDDFEHVDNVSVALREVARRLPAVSGRSVRKIALRAVMELGALPSTVAAYLHAFQTVLPGNSD